MSIFLLCFSVTGAVFLEPCSTNQREAVAEASPALFADRLFEVPNIPVRDFPLKNPLFRDDIFRHLYVDVFLMP